MAFGHKRWAINMFIFSFFFVESRVKRQRFGRILRSDRRPQLLSIWEDMNLFAHVTLSDWIVKLDFHFWKRPQIFKRRLTWQMEWLSTSVFFPSPSWSTLIYIKYEFATCRSHEGLYAWLWKRKDNFGVRSTTCFPFNSIHRAWPLGKCVWEK